MKLNLQFTIFHYIFCPRYYMRFQIVYNDDSFELLIQHKVDCLYLMINFNTKQKL